MSTAATRRVTAAFRSGPLAVRSFRLLAGGQFASTIGDYCYAVALPWLVLSNHGSTVLLGIVLACYGVPRTVLIPVGGILADKLGPRTLMLFADVMRCALVGVLTFLAARHTASLVTLGPTAALIGAGEGLFLPASFTIMPSLLDGPRLAAGNALSSTAVQAGSLIGPAIGGALVAITGASTAAFGIDAVSFAVSAVSLALIPRRAAAGTMAASSAETADSMAGQADSLTRLADTAPDSPATGPDGPAAEPPGKPQGMLAYIRQSRAIQVIMIVAIAANLAQGGLGEVALPALAHAHWGAGGYGALLACLAAGAVIGTLAAARSGGLRNPAMVASVAFIIGGGAISLVPYLGGEAGAAAALLFLGACNGLGNVLFYTMAQRSIPSAILGRVLSMIMLCSAGTFPLSVAVTGVLIRHIGTTPFFPIAGVFLVVAVLGGNSQRAFRDFGRQAE
ncbi:MAG TPA: MFS transporter, partial [Streptosporangiaceae bacterium]|nr:MFS transporter [Streptosporangiaceae bacterium]